MKLRTAGIYNYINSRGQRSLWRNHKNCASCVQVSLAPLKRWTKLFSRCAAVNLRSAQSRIAFANSRGTSVLTQLQLLRVTRAGSACRGTPSQGVPPTPLLCFLEDTRTLGRCPKPRWGLNPQTPLALRGCQLSIYIRRKAKSCAAKRRTYSRGTTNWRNHKNCASCVQAQPGWGLYSK